MSKISLIIFTLAEAKSRARVILPIVCPLGLDENGRTSYLSILVDLHYSPMDVLIPFVIRIKFEIMLEKLIGYIGTVGF